MSADSINKPRPTVPDHIPPELVEWFDFHTDAGYKADPHARLEELRSRGRVFFTPYARGLNGMGTWIFTRAEDIRAIFQDAETFPSGGLRPWAQSVGDHWRLTPIEIDPPEHAKYRGFLNPFFSPARIQQLSESIKLRAQELIQPLLTKPQFNFLEEFAKPFPISIFLGLIGFPFEEMPRFVAIADDINHGAPEAVVSGIRRCRDYLGEQIKKRRAQPGQDLFSQILNKPIDGRALTDEEMMGISFNLFLGGLDTVRSTLGYVFCHLADNQDQQHELRAKPDLIPDAIEELLRLYNVSITGRFASRDVEFGGVFIKKGDNLAIPTSLASRDPGEFEHSDEVNFQRSPNRHSAFGFGVHRCMGSHLARLELTTAVRAWTALPSPFALATPTRPLSRGPAVVGLKELQLIWGSPE
jgi:cytochrome P450